jgi:hypothetical protein
MPAQPVHASASSLWAGTERVQASCDKRLIRADLRAQHGTRCRSHSVHDLSMVSCRKPLLSCCACTGRCLGPAMGRPVAARELGVKAALGAEPARTHLALDVQGRFARVGTGMWAAACSCAHCQQGKGTAHRSQNSTQATTCERGASAHTPKPDSNAPSAASPAPGAIAPTPRRAIRARPARAAMPAPAQAPQATLKEPTPCGTHRQSVYRITRASVLMHPATVLMQVLCNNGSHSWPAPCTDTLCAAQQSRSELAGFACVHGVRAP